MKDVALKKKVRRTVLETSERDGRKMSVELKLKSFTPAEIAEIVDGKLELYGGNDGNIPQNYISTDSRESGEGVIFCAIKGQNVDGNDYIPSAVEAGSTAFICQFVPDEAKTCGKSFAAVIVEDTVKAMGTLAAYYRGISDAKVIAITGSVGKTTTKEFIYAMFNTMIFMLLSGIVLLCFKEANKKSFVLLSPFIALGTIIALVAV